MNSTKHTDTNCWYDLNLRSDKILNPNFKWPDVDQAGRNMVWYYQDPTVIVDERWLESVRMIGLEFNSFMLFWRPAGFQNIEAHVDVLVNDPTKTAVAAVNMVLKGRGSRMSWYQTPPGNHEVQWTMAKTPYLTWPVKDLDLIESRELGSNLALVRVDIPHAIFCSNEDRWCISMRFPSKGLNWEDLVDHLGHQDLLIPR